MYKHCIYQWYAHLKYSHIKKLTDKIQQIHPRKFGDFVSHIHTYMHTYSLWHTHRFLSTFMDFLNCWSKPHWPSDHRLRALIIHHLDICVLWTHTNDDDQQPQNDLEFSIILSSHVRCYWCYWVERKGNEESRDLSCLHFVTWISG